MRALIEIAACVTLSVGAHVLVLAQPGGVGPVGQGGDSGAEVLTLAALPGDLADRVADWTRAPEVTTDVATDAAVPQPLADPVTLPAVAPAMPSAPALPDRPALALPQAEALPQVDAVPPAPPAPKPVVQPAAPARSTAAPAPRAAELARGSGKADSAGAAAATRPRASIGQGTSQQLLAQWGAQLRASVERNKRYPVGARAAGKVQLRLSVATEGRLHGVSIVRSSGDAALDRAAVEAVRRARFSKAPKGLAAGVHAFNLSIAFSR